MIEYSSSLDCKFQLNEYGMWQCSICGWKYILQTNKPPHRNCPKLKKSKISRPSKPTIVIKPKQKSKPPSLIKRSKSYIDERQRWKAAGKPTRSIELIKYIFETFCKSCEHFSGKICNICGCYINDDDGWNKIAWKTTNCPLEKPKWDQNTQLPDDKKKAQETPPKPKLKPKKKKGGGGCGK